MNPFQNIIDCYDKTAAIYAEKFYNELNHKPLEQQLLRNFLAANLAKGIIVDLGCGPGHILHYLQQHGAHNLLGIDISPEMIQVARPLNPTILFEVGNILELNHPDHTFGSALAFYSLIYFDYETITRAFKEIKRVLKPDGDFLFSFHIGNEMVHFEEFLGHSVSMGCQFFEPAKIQKLVMECGFAVLDVIERDPYPGIEFPSRRAYFWVRKQIGV